jgi:hypothetical protein
MENESENRIDMLEEAMFRAFRDGDGVEWSPSPGWKSRVMDAVAKEAESAESADPLEDIRFETILFRTACALAGIAASIALVVGVSGGGASNVSGGDARSVFNDDIQALYYDDPVSELLLEDDAK